ncbi:hypothetical protein SPRG_19762 [Saprolegnia parasitica CBS 223.65]|uniref:Uncharacterized protein n=1 Tax=Saprolegnia parasitica (strain CBS 223.65) TaxID=695850 RepID=A0A067CLX8_SAPPC|nr:hypothetical protein SPRG_19762 [Saprolegnia parasitica CBS 223.65]KDO30200.1 hypothetical protein SPRG_19762 [Saprolegnia parasitica CBS 223.65]|eukprot:XP_012199018.1 hypothetical protein SPRG_19762 [Saprolegnia parasitica CBS 223.65]
MVWSDVGDVFDVFVLDDGRLTDVDVKNSTTVAPKSGGFSVIVACGKTDACHVAWGLQWSPPLPAAHRALASITGCSYSGTYETTTSHDEITFVCDFVQPGLFTPTFNSTLDAFSVGIYYGSRAAGSWCLNDCYTIIAPYAFYSTRTESLLLTQSGTYTVTILCINGMNHDDRPCTVGVNYNFRTSPPVPISEDGSIEPAFTNSSMTSRETCSYYARSVQTTPTAPYLVFACDDALPSTPYSVYVSSVDNFKVFGYNGMLDAYDYDRLRYGSRSALAFQGESYAASGYANSGKNVLVIYCANDYHAPCNFTVQMTMTTPAPTYAPTPTPALSVCPVVGTYAATGMRLTLLVDGTFTESSESGSGPTCSIMGRYAISEQRATFLIMTVSGGCTSPFSPNAKLASVFIFSSDCQRLTLNLTSTPVLLGRSSDATTAMTSAVMLMGTLIAWLTLEY